MKRSVIFILLCALWLCAAASAAEIEIASEPYEADNRGRTTMGFTRQQSGESMREELLRIFGKDMSYTDIVLKSGQPAVRFHCWSDGGYISGVGVYGLTGFHYPHIRAGIMPDAARWARLEDAADGMFMDDYEPLRLGSFEISTLARDIFNSAGSRTDPVSCAYLTYEEAGFDFDVFDENTFMPGSYEHFEAMYHYGVIDTLYPHAVMLTAGSAHGSVVGCGLSFVPASCAAVGILADEEGYFICVNFAADPADAVWLVADYMSRMTHNGDPVVVSDYVGEIAIDSAWLDALSSGDSLGRTLVNGRPVTLPEGCGVYSEERNCVKFESGGAKTELYWYPAVGLSDEQVNIGLTENGLDARINGVSVLSRDPVGIENADAYPLTLPDGSDATVYSGVISTPSRDIYYLVAGFITDRGVAMPYISSDQPIDATLMETAAALYFR